MAALIEIFVFILVICFVQQLKALASRRKVGAKDEPERKQEKGQLVFVFLFRFFASRGGDAGNELWKTSPRVPTWPRMRDG